MRIKVVRAGLLASIQDLGRRGYQKYGVLVNGAMDTYSLRVANVLAGNRESDGALEITLLGPVLQFEKSVIFAITGGNLSPTLDGAPVPMWRPVYAARGSILRFGACQSGCRAYLAVAGGFSIPEVMGSQSTYLRAGIGGFQGRSLQAGDMLEAGAKEETAATLKRQLGMKTLSPWLAAVGWYAGKQYIPRDVQDIVVRVTVGNQFENFTPESKQQFFHCSFQVTTQSDRMGYRLAGSPLQLSAPLEMISEAVTFGTVQVPPDGNPIILLADRQTAGGYPKIAQVALADLQVVAQARPGSKIRFKEINLTEAERLYLKQEEDLQQIKTSVKLKLN